MHASKLIPVQCVLGGASMSEIVTRKGQCIGTMSVWSPAGFPAQGLPKKGESPWDPIPVPKVASAHRQPGGIGQHVLLWYLHTVHDNHTRG